VRSRGLRLTIRGSMVVVALLAVVLAFGIIPLSREIERQNTAREYRQVADGITSAILALEKRVPNGVTRSEWLSAVELTALAHFNTCHRWHPPPLGELYSLREDLLLKLGGPVDIRTVAWIWDRLASTCADGKDYTDRNRRSLEKCFPSGTIPGSS
jgi:hypothetical protein